MNIILFRKKLLLNFSLCKDWTIWCKTWHLVYKIVTLAEILYSLSTPWSLRLWTCSTDLLIIFSLQTVLYFSWLRWIKGLLAELINAIRDVWVLEILRIRCNISYGRFHWFINIRELFGNFWWWVYAKKYWLRVSSKWLNFLYYD